MSYATWLDDSCDELVDYACWVVAADTGYCGRGLSYYIAEVDSYDDAVVVSCD